MLSLAATVIVLFALGGITVFADETDEPQSDIIASGYCGAEGNGENLSWTLDSKGLLTISGTGKMADYSIENIPWMNNRTDIKVVNIVEGVTCIGEFAFYYCTSLTSIDIPDGVTYISYSAFRGCSSLTSITIPNGVTSIGNYAFKGCSLLTSITIPNGVTRIGDYAFEGCSLLTSITIPNGVTYISYSAFRGCSSLTSITIPNGVTSIDEYAFEGCSLLTSITIPNGVTSIGENAFYGCSALVSVNIPDSVTSIGENVFYGCSALVSVNIPDSVTSIGENAFHGCSALISVTIPDSVTSIGYSAFSSCTSLVSITVPNSVTSIARAVFSHCSSLASITIPDSVTSIDDFAFDSCTSLVSITIPNSVIIIDDYAFANCTSLVSITIPNSVTSIDDHAFYRCASLTSIDIPNSVTSIEEDAFTECENISEIYFNIDPKYLNIDLSSIFSSSIKAYVIVPAAYLSDYVTLFSSFENIILADTDGNMYLGSGIHLYGYSLILDGSIGVNFYMKLSETVLNNEESAYMEFTVNEKTQQVPVKDATIKDGYYIFRCDVVAKEMADKITAQVYLSEGNPIGDAYTYSVQEYAAYIIDHPERFPAGAVDLVKAMLNYGAASQKYFNHNTDYLANSILPASEQQSSSSSHGNLTYYNAGDITPEKISLSLKSTITLKLYFKTDDLKIDELNYVTSFECTKYQLTTTVSGDYTIVIIEGIPATNFSGIISIKCYLNEGDEYKTVKIKPSNYAYIALKQPVGGVITDDLKEVVRALYQFSLAANEYNLVQPA